uniref:Mesoderm induction early response protein 1 n=1 Tax=Panagrellus redivivus TaxID=6233 RepID=A0A7E4WAA7_PANRE
MSENEDYEDLHDFEEGDDDDDGIDNEDTLAEEELLGDEDNDLDALQEEAEMDIEELRRRYCGIPDDASSNPPAPPPLAEAVASAHVSGGLEGTLGQAAGQPQGPASAGMEQPGQGLPLDSSGSTNETNGTEQTEPEPESELRRFMQAGSDNLASYGSDDDDDYLPEVTPRIGPQYQHETMPEIIPNYVPNHDADLLWRPTDTLNDDQIDKYLESVAACSIDFMMNKEPGCEAVPVRKPPNKKRIPPPGLTSETTPLFWDNEEALFLLLKHNYDPAAAKADFEQGPPDVNLPRKSHFGIYPSWTQEDMRNFEIGMHAYMKNFHRLRHEYLPAKSVGEIVHFYYRWKKTERHDAWKANHFPAFHGPRAGTEDSNEAIPPVNNPLIPPDVAANVIAQAEAARLQAEQYFDQQYLDGGYEGGEDDNVQD